MTASWVRVVTPILLGKITNDIQMRGRALPPGSVAKEPSGDVAPQSQEWAGDDRDKAGRPPAPVGGQKRSLVGSYVLWLACAFGGIGLGLGMRYSQAALDVNMANAIRERLFSRIIRERLEFFHAHDAGRLTLLINQMSVEAQVAIRQTVLEPVFQTFGFLLAASGLVYSFAQLQQEGGSPMAWMGVVVVILVAMLSPFAVSRFGRRLQASSAAVLGQNMALASLVNGSLNAPEEVQSFNAEDFFAAKYGLNLEGIRASRIDQTPGFSCATVCASAEEALKRMPEAAPDVVLMDIHLPGLSGIDCVARLRRLLPVTQVIMLTVEEDSEQVFESLKAGATGYLVKHVTPEEILEAVAEVHQGGAPMSSQVARRVVTAFRQRPPVGVAEVQLTPREEAILRLLAQGGRSKEIADQLGISTGTVNTHVRHIYEKLHVRSRAEAVARFVKH